MSLIYDLNEVKKLCERMEQEARRKETVNFELINGIVRLQQEYRVAKNYVISDALRALLKSVGVVITQGTAGYEYDEIPSSLKGRPVGDTWDIQQ